MRVLRRSSRRLADPEKARSRPRHTGDPARDPAQRGVTLAFIFEPVVENVYGMHLLMPFPNQFGPRPQGNHRGITSTAPLLGAGGKRTKPPLGAGAQTAQGTLLNQIRNPANQQVAAQPGGRCCTTQVLPLDPQVAGAQRFECSYLGFDISFLGLAARGGFLNMGRLAGVPASPVVMASRRHAPASTMR